MQVLQFKPKDQHESDCTRSVGAHSGLIDISVLERSTSSTRTLSPGDILPSVEHIESEAVCDHAADPIKNIDQIYHVIDYLTEHGRYRDNMLFVVGINFGLRASDLRMLRFSDLINENITFKESFPVFEIKTRNTRKRKKNRYITINDAVIDAVTLYLKNTPNVHLSDYMFRSLSNNGSMNNEPISRQSIDRLLKSIANDCGLDMHVSTHTLRKTFCYWMMVCGHNDHRRLLLLQKMLNHSSPLQTLDYIGLTEEEIVSAYKDLNLGSESERRKFSIVYNNIYEREEAPTA